MLNGILSSLKGRHFYYLAGLIFLFSLYFLFYLGLQTYSGLSSPHEDQVTAEPPELEAEPEAARPQVIQALPPLYSRFHNAELRLPQQNWNQSRPGPHEKFLLVAGHTRGLGWGNAVQEHILNAYLAFKAGRSFVFGNFTWNDDGSLYSDYEGTGKLIPSQIPYSVFLRGKYLPFHYGVNAPLAVSKAYFDYLCPNRLELSRADIHANLSSPNSVAEITKKWVSVLQGLDEPVFGVRNALIDVWSDLKRSPFITHFGWSPLVELAFDTNRDIFIPGESKERPLSSQPYTSNAERYTMIPGLMVIHVRRGDYETHCRTLAMWSEDFVSVNAFPEMPDAFAVPPHEQWGNNTAENVEIYRARCLPTFEEIAHKVRGVLATPEAQGVKRLYIMTNGRPEYIRDLKGALWGVGKWDMISSSRDLVLTWEQKFASHAVDQLVAQRAQVFIGNGFSTLTSNAVMMRMANGFPTESTRFW
ncbi:hypothetical protein BN946_scf184994.g44 [Trametes cinnabarina]|uniref:Uncharacterized protein n=1 Tax=Pycnoporus cinnabarinus TaxID=5643 RepID=A0A060SF42_PYCCI|nr:hypothetical protein BN946_scf184994.g44 [Trametes cinnabarina]